MLHMITHKYLQYLINCKGGEISEAEVKNSGGKCNVIYGLPLRKIGPIMHHSVSSTEDKGIFSFYNADISCDISPRRSLKQTYVTFQTTNLLLKQKTLTEKTMIFICILNCVRWVMNFQQNQQRYSKYPEQKTLNIILGKVIAAKIEIHCKCLQGFTGTLRGGFCNICRENPVIFTDCREIPANIAGFPCTYCRKNPQSPCKPL